MLELLGVFLIEFKNFTANAHSLGRTALIYARAGKFNRLYHFLCSVGPDRRGGRLHHQPGPPTCLGFVGFISKVDANLLFTIHFFFSSVPRAWSVKNYDIYLSQNMSPKIINVVGSGKP